MTENAVGILAKVKGYQHSSYAKQMPLGQLVLLRSRISTSKATLWIQVTQPRAGPFLAFKGKGKGKPAPGPNISMERRGF